MRSSNQKNQLHTDQYLSAQQTSVVKRVATSINLLKTASVYFSISILFLIGSRVAVPMIERRELKEQHLSTNQYEGHNVSVLFLKVYYSQINKVILSNLHSVDDFEKSSSEIENRGKRSSIPGKCNHLTVQIDVARDQYGSIAIIHVPFASDCTVVLNECISAR